METRRTNQFLKVALGSRSPGRAKYFKSKFHEMSQEQSRLQFNRKRPPMTSYPGARGQLDELDHN